MCKAHAKMHAGKTAMERMGAAAKEVNVRADKTSKDKMDSLNQQCQCLTLLIGCIGDYCDYR